MAEDLQFTSRMDNKRKYEDQTAPPPSSASRVTGFSPPITTPSSDLTHAPPPSSYNNVPIPVDEIQLAKQRAQEIAARLFSTAEAKRPRVENGGSTDETNSSASADIGQKPPSHQFGNFQVGSFIPSSMPANYGFGSSKKIDIPNGRVGVIIGKSGETIKYLQLQSGAKIHVTKDVDADPYSPNRLVELVGTPEQISKAEQLIKDVLAEAESGGSGARRIVGQAGSEQFSMKVPNNKVGLIIGKGGETIKNMQARSGARIQVIPLHLPPGDLSTERTVQIDGTKEQVESAKQLVNEIITGENRSRNSQMAGGYPQQGYNPPTSWAPPGPPSQQPSYGYTQTGSYPGAPPPYNTTQQPYTGYPPQPTPGGYSSGWDQTPVPPSQQTAPGTDNYTQQSLPQQQPLQYGTTPQDNTGYNYNQPVTTYNQQGYSQDAYGGTYQATTTQPGYDQLQGYNSVPSYGSVPNPTQDVPSPAQPPAQNQQGYGGPTQVTPQPGYVMPQTSQPGYGNQPHAQTGYGQSAPLTQPSYGVPPPQKLPSQPGYGQTQPTQPDSGQYRPPLSNFGSPVPQTGYGTQPHGVPGYGQQPYTESYGGGGYSQPPLYSSDGTGGGNVHGSYDGASSNTQAVQQNGVPKTSPPS